MDHYLRFVTMLAAGLFGLGLVLKVLLDGLLAEWDAAADLKAWVRGLSEHRGRSLSLQRAEDLMLEVEKNRAPTLNTRLIEQKREQLQELSRVEHRLSLPNRPVVLDPLPPPQPAEADAGADWVLGKT